MECQARSRRRLLAVLGLGAALTGLGIGRPTADERDLVAAASGGQVIKYTSELGGDWRAARLIDGAAAPGGWASADASMPQEIIFRLPASTRFNTLVFMGPGDPARGQWAREVAVYAADPFPTMGGWKLVAQVELVPEPGDQSFSVPASDGRFIRLLITRAQSADAPRVSLGKFKLFMR